MFVYLKCGSVLFSFITDEDLWVKMFYFNKTYNAQLKSQISHLQHDKQYSTTVHVQ